MSKKSRQYVGLFSAVVAYYIVHEGAHLVYAMLTDVFKAINVVGFGIQIDVYAEKMTDVQMGIFCIAGSVATLICGYVLVLFMGRICLASSKVFKACMYYITLAMLFIDPLYLSLLCSFFGGGDMNGISLLVPEMIVGIIYGVILLINGFLFAKFVLPAYKSAFGTKTVI